MCMGVYGGVCVACEAYVDLQSHLGISMEKGATSALMFHTGDREHKSSCWWRLCLLFLASQRMRRSSTHATSCSCLFQRPL